MSKGIHAGSGLRDNEEAIYEAAEARATEHNPLPNAAFFDESSGLEGAWLFSTKYGPPRLQIDFAGLGSGATGTVSLASVGGQKAIRGFCQLDEAQFRALYVESGRGIAVLEGRKPSPPLVTRGVQSADELLPSAIWGFFGGLVHRDGFSAAEAFIHEIERHFAALRTRLCKECGGRRFGCSECSPPAGPAGYTRREATTPSTWWWSPQRALNWLAVNPRRWTAAGLHNIAALDPTERLNLFCNMDRLLASDAGERDLRAGQGWEEWLTEEPPDPSSPVGPSIGGTDDTAAPE